MDEYIKREDAVNTVLDAYFNTPKVNLKGELFYREILKIPAADVEPVVRCKDCLFWEFGKNECESWEWCKILHCNMPLHAFCNFGVRKDEAE